MGKKKIKDFTKQDMLKWIMQTADFLSEFFDNWFFLVRVGLIRYYSKWQEKWVDYISSLGMFTFLILSIVDKFVTVYKDALKKYNQQIQEKALSDKDDKSTEETGSSTTSLDALYT